MTRQFISGENSRNRGTVTVFRYGEKLEGILDNRWAFECWNYLNEENSCSAFRYEESPLEETVVQLICAEDIYAADVPDGILQERSLEQYHGRNLSKDTVVATGRTDRFGRVDFKELPAGSYYLREIQVADGYVCDEKTEFFTLKFHGCDIEEMRYESNKKNERQKVKISLVKTSSATGLAVENAIYGLYTAMGFYNTNEKMIMEADELIESGKTDQEGKIVFLSDLPLGLYYLREIEPAPGYMQNPDKYEIDASYQGQKISVIEKEIYVQDVPYKVAEESDISAIDYAKKYSPDLSAVIGK